MFKGLRTKIESEQKGTSSGTIDLRPIPNNTASTKSDSLTKDKPNLASSVPNPSNLHEQHAATHISFETDPKSSVVEDTTEPNHAASQKESNRLHSKVATDALEKSDNAILTLDQQIIKLSDQLKTVMREKEESNDQNAQLYQLIEKLRRNLENEKEINSSLKLKLDEAEEKIRKPTEQTTRGNRTTNISIKSFNPELYPTKVNGNNSSNEVEVLRQEIIDLQVQLAKKNRLLRIKQQNLTDIKKTLQKELLDHGKTQEELLKLQKHLKDQESLNIVDQSNAPLARQNGSTPSDLADTGSHTDHNQHSVDRSIQEPGYPSKIHPGDAVAGTELGGEDAISLSAVGVGGTQLDRLSYLSRSSASVDDFEHNDLQQSNYNREVNHQYLKNVLFRYMTSTDRETTQHLVKALSVLMDFSPDQSAAIKCAMNARSSWLRLK